MKTGNRTDLILEVHSLVSHTTREGRVEIIADGRRIAQFDVAKAREVHRMLGEAIEAAISDELLVKFLIEKVGLATDAAVMALRDFRVMRQGTADTVFPH